MFRPFKIALLALCVAGPATAQGGPAMVGIETVETRRLAETVPIFAEVVTARDGQVASRVSGSVRVVEAVEGDTVQAGDTLVQLDPELLSILLRRAEAEVSVAEAGRNVARARTDTARMAFERVAGLEGTASFSSGRFDDAQGLLLEAQRQIAEADARLAVAQAAQAEAAYNLDRATIVAPFDGVVLDVLVNPGEFIQAGSPALRLLDTSTLELEASVPARYVALMEPGLTVTARAETGDDFEVAVRALLPIETAATRTRPVRFAAPDLAASRTTALGQSVTVMIPVDTPRDLLTVPKDALVQARGGWTVFAVEDGIAQPRSVEVGLAVGDRFEVVSGVADGDVVVVRGNERLRPGQEVAAMPPEAPAGSPETAEASN
ncbi:MAG: efflux RND transporter periplasmic adaptor subunit [Pseudomonadota bacterium]